MDSLVRRALASFSALAAAFVFTSCSGGGGALTSGGTTAMPPANANPRAAVSSQFLYAPGFLAKPFGFSAELIFPADADGNVAPSRIISGIHTNINDPRAVVVDSKGNIYVSNAANGGADGEIMEYPPNANGDVAPIRTFGGLVSALAIDSADTIYAAEVQSLPERTPDRIQIYKAGTSVPARTITGPDTDLSVPVSIAVDAEGRIYVGNNGPGPCGPRGSVTVYASDASGDAKPIAAFNNIVSPWGLAIDARGNVYINSYEGPLRIFAPHLGFTNPLPIATINTQNEYPIGHFGIALDEAGNIYEIHGYPRTAVFVYPPLGELRPDGNTAPIRAISGDNTLLMQYGLEITVH